MLLCDPGLSLDDLGERPQRHAVAVRQAASLAPRYELRIGVDDPVELVHETALPDPWNADERHELRRALVPRAIEGVADDAKLTVTSDQRRARLVCDVDAEARMRREACPDCDGLGLALRLEGSALLVVDRVPRGAVGRLVRDAVDRCGALEPRGGVHDVA